MAEEENRSSLRGDLDSANLSENGEGDVSVSDLVEFSKIRNALMRLMSDVDEGDVDLSTLDTKRYNESSDTNDIKIGSLELPPDEKEDDCEEKESENDKFAKYYLTYFANLAKNGSDKEFNYEYVENLCNNTEVNITDVYGQSVMHEVAREWNTDVAMFLKFKGVNIDVADQWGRTPLFVAVAANNTEMIRWLIKNDADANHRTMKGEGQLPLHYAARYDALEAADVLLELGANPLARDDNDRTPFFLAAKLGIVRICSYFLDLELPVVSYDNNGEATIDHIILNLPLELVTKALNQFIVISPTDTSWAFLYLSCLGKRRWRLLQRSHGKPLPSYIAPSALEMITERKDYNIINHPVVIELIKLKRMRYGNKYFMLNNILNLLFTVIWTVSASIRIGNIDEALPNKESRDTILYVTIAGQLLTFVLMFKLYLEWKGGRNYVDYEKKRQGVEIYHARPLCHPRWTIEMKNLEGRVDVVKNSTFEFWNNGWILIEISCFFLAFVFTIITILWYLAEEGIITFPYEVRLFYSAFFVLVVWIRLNRCFKYHQTFGAFVGMLEECSVASAQIGFLFLEFYLPFAVAFWVFFGRTEVEEGSDEYFSINNLLYQLWVLTFIGDYDFDTLTLINRLNAQILVGLYILVVSIITFNIFIALLSEAFARVSGIASQSAYMQEAAIYNKIERIFPEIKRNFETYLNEHCAPTVVDKKKVLGRSDDASARSIVTDAIQGVREIEASMGKVVEFEDDLKKDIEKLTDRFNSFQVKYTENTSLQMINEVRKILTKQATGVNYVMMKTNETVARYVEYIKEKYLS